VIRAVLDTNLIVSYLLTQGETMSRLIAHWEQGRYVYLVSPQMVAELNEVVNRPRLRQYMRSDPAVLLELIEADAELTPGKLVLKDVCRDPKDDQFIACALEGEATYLVTGDADLLEMESYQGVIMIRAYDFAEMLDRQF
jgi:uncharacterized protein